MGIDDADSMKANEWRRLDGVASTGGLRGVVDDCVMIEAWGHKPILTSGEILAWMMNNKSTIPQSERDIQYLDQMLYFRNPQQLAVRVVEEALGQLATKVQVGKPLSEWIDVIIEDYPQHLNEGLWVWAQRNPKLIFEVPYETPGQNVWMRLWETIAKQEASWTCDHGLVSCWFKAGGPQLNEEQARVLWKICSTSGSMVPDHVAATVRRAVLGVYAGGEPALEEEDVRDI